MGHESLPAIYGLAVLLPLISFFAILIFAKWLGDKAAWVATGAIGFAGVLSFAVLILFWLPSHFPPAPPPHHGAAHGPGHEAAPSDPHARPDAHHRGAGSPLSTSYVALVQEVEPAESRSEEHTSEL